MLPDIFANYSAKIIKKSHFESSQSNRKIDNVIFEKRSNRPRAMLGTWRTKSSRLDFCWLLRYLVNAHVYSSNGNVERYTDILPYKVKKGQNLVNVV